MPARDDVLVRLLSGRDERACVQRFMLGIAGVSCLMQISLNIPGVPKDIPECEAAFSLSVSRFAEMSGLPPPLRVSVFNWAGRAEILALGCSPSDAKTAAMNMEDCEPWGRAVDADVITPEGPLSRRVFGREPRACLLCGEPANVCARLRSHGIEELRAEVRRLLALASR